jgi:FtsH-binding integral membrane protein
MSQTYDFPRDEPVVFDLEVDERASFLTRTYAHLFGAIAAFVLIAIGLFQTSIPEQMTRFIAGNSWGWLLFLGGFMIVGMLASRAALQARTPPVQYLALGGFVAAEAIIFLPLLYIADRVAPGAIQSAALITLVGFAGLTGIVYFTRKDFSFLRGVVLYGGIVALLVIVGAVAFGLQLGMWFSVAMIAFAGASILYNTSEVMHRYPADRHVAAALSLFASVALMFWYVLQLLISLRE